MKSAGEGELWVKGPGAQPGPFPHRDVPNMVWMVRDGASAPQNRHLEGVGLPESLEETDWTIQGRHEYSLGKPAR